MYVKDLNTNGYFINQETLDCLKETGCRALAYAFTGDQLGVDPAKCLFFENGYHRKIESALAGWENLQKVT